MRAHGPQFHILTISGIWFSALKEILLGNCVLGEPREPEQLNFALRIVSWPVWSYTVVTLFALAAPWAQVCTEHRYEEAGTGGVRGSSRSEPRVEQFKSLREPFSSLTHLCDTTCFVSICPVGWFAKEAEE